MKLNVQTSRVSHLTSHGGTTIFPLATLTSPCGRLTLTPLTAADLPALYAIMHPQAQATAAAAASGDISAQQDPNAHPYFGGFPYGPFATLAEYAHYCQLHFFSRADSIAFVIRTRHLPDGSGSHDDASHPPAIAGLIALHSADPVHLRVGGHVWYAEAYRGGFVGKAAPATLLVWLFEELGFRRVEWKSLVTNVASFKAGLALGFVYEGRARAFVVGREPEKERMDMENLGMTDEEWFGIPSRAAEGQEQGEEGGVRRKMWRKIGLL